MSLLLLWFAAFATALFFAANIGASGTAAAMGAAYGGGALNRRIGAVILVAVFAVLGALLGGGEVVKTISGGIIPSSIITIEISIIIICSAAITLFMANQLGIPLSTSEVTVGSIVGVGLAFHEVYWQTVLLLVVIWILLPFVSFCIAYGLGRIFRPAERMLLKSKSRAVITFLKLLLIGMGCYEAFSAGMNNVANAVGPLVGAGMLDARSGIWWGSAFLAIGAITMGGRVLETNGKKITKLSLLQGSVASFTSGSLVIAASLFGLPVPLTQATTMAIIGLGSEDVGWVLLRKPVVRKIFKIWLYSPVYSMFISLTLVQIIIHGSLIFLTLLILFSTTAFTAVYVRQKNLDSPEGRKRFIPE